MTTNRIVVDTNILVSFLLIPNSPPNKAVKKAIHEGTLLVSDDTLEELSTVLASAKFNNYISIEDRQEFIRKLLRITEKVTITKRIQECRDPKDDKFLEVAINGRATIIISGDQDLLVMNPSKDFEIVSPVEYLKQ